MDAIDLLLEGRIRAAGTIFGMPVMIDREMPNDRIRFVDPATGRHTDFLLPADPA